MHTNIKYLANVIKADVTMESILSHRGFQTSRKRRIPCPIHNGKNPNFSYRDNKHYKCFKCGAHGTIIDFVMWADDLSAKEAIIRIAEEFGVGEPLEFATSAGQEIAACRVAEAERKRAYEELHKSLMDDISLCIREGNFGLQNGELWSEAVEIAIKEKAWLEYMEEELEGEGWEAILSDSVERVRSICSQILGERN